MPQTGEAGHGAADAVAGFGVPGAASAGQARDGIASDADQAQPLRRGIGTHLDEAGGGAEEGGALGVNAYLWRAALDTLGFMPLASADPFGGVIITDWFSPPETPDEPLARLRSTRATARGSRSAIRTATAGSSRRSPRVCLAV